MRPHNVKDLTNQEFERLTAKERVGSRVSGGNRYAVWRCECKCGGETLSTSRDLRTGHAKSCGCLRKEGLARAALQKRQNRPVQLHITSRRGRMVNWRNVDAPAASCLERAQRSLSKNTVSLRLVDDRAGITWEWPPQGTKWPVAQNFLDSFLRMAKGPGK